MTLEIARTQRIALSGVVKSMFGIAVGAGSVLVEDLQLISRSSCGELAQQVARKVSQAMSSGHEAVELSPNEIKFCKACVHAYLAKALMQDNNSIAGECQQLLKEFGH